MSRLESEDLWLEEVAIMRLCEDGYHVMIATKSSREDRGRGF